MRLHLHNFKTKDVFLEQPVLDRFGNHMTFAGKPVYIDYIVKRCKCGKEKKVSQFNGIYFADKHLVQINHEGVMVERLCNKTALI